MKKMFIKNETKVQGKNRERDNEPQHTVDCIIDGCCAKISPTRKEEMIEENGNYRAGYAQLEKKKKELLGEGNRFGMKRSGETVPIKLGSVTRVLTTKHFFIWKKFQV